MTESPFIAGLRMYFDTHPHIKPATISARVGDKSTIRKLLDGTVSTPTLATAVKISEALGTTVEAIIAGGVDKPSIPIAGRVGAGAQVPLFDHTESGGLFQVAEPPQLRNSPKPIGAVQVEGTSMLPIYQPDDVLFFSRTTHEGIPDEDVGRICIVEDVAGNAWVKQVTRGTAPGLFHLLSLNPQAENRHDQTIQWAARVLLAVPAEMVEQHP